MEKIGQVVSTIKFGRDSSDSLFPRIYLGMTILTILASKRRQYGTYDQDDLPGSLSDLVEDWNWGVEANKTQESRCEFLSLHFDYTAFRTRCGQKTGA